MLRSPLDRVLAGFYDGEEPTSAECIRSFAVVPFVGTDWLAELDRSTDVRVQVKPQHHQQATLKNSQVYGWRGRDPRVYYLSPWEFTAFWEVHRLQPPRGEASDFSVWVNGAPPNPQPEDGVQFGRDYVWKTQLPQSNQEVVRMPQRLTTKAVADHYLIRRRAPLVPYPTATPLPKADMAKADQCRLLNVYLRPWTLAGDDASPHVPHIAALDQQISDRQQVPVRRCTGKTRIGRRCHAAAWQDYIKHHIVSEHAKRTIRNFLAAAECSPEDVTEEDVDATKVPRQDVDTSLVDVTTVQRLTAGEGFQYSKRSAQTVQNIVQQWTPQTVTNTSSRPVTVCAGIPDPGAPVPAPDDHTKPKQGQDPPQPVDISYAGFRPELARSWLNSLQFSGSPPVPSTEQCACLTAIINRCEEEMQDERTEAVHRSEPLRAILHGVPGAGKSQTLHWLRQYFEMVCGWEHLREFAFVAPQNTQAALINGVTLHSFAELKVKGQKQEQRTSFGPGRFVKFQRLRWLVIDECSTAALEVLAALEKQLLDATRPKQSWKLRKSGAVRPFAGLNVLIAGDCYQFPAVKATSIFQNPFKSGQSIAVTQLQKILWTHNQANVQHLFELTQEHRCTDPWLSAVLKAARHGVVTQEMWAFLHGFPTLHAGSWNPLTNKCACGVAPCQALAKTWDKEILDPKQQKTWQDRQRAECSLCATERRRRCIVAGAAEFGPDPKATKFLQAPFVHGLNAAKYVAALLRARWVAAEQQHLLLWAVAQDTPLFHADPESAEHELRVRKENWLQRHDQATAGIMGLLPLLPNMPVRITQTLPELKPLGLFKNTRGHLWNGSLQPEDIPAVEACTDPELVLQHLPACLFIAVPGATWQQHSTLPPGVACIRPSVQHWKLESHGAASIARKGFPIACDYAGTAHSFMGATLPACSLDLGFWDSTANRDGQLSAYMCLSRVKSAEDLCVARPFSPNLLSQGELIGPDTFLGVHRQMLTLAEAQKRFEKDHVQRRRNNETLLFCRGCSRKAKDGKGLLPLREFTTNNVWDPDAWYNIVKLGMERLCSQCRESHNPRPNAAQAPAAAASNAPGVPCAFCAKTNLPQLGFCQQCLAKERLACARCDVGMKLKPKTLKHFSPEEIQRRKRTKELRKARCIECELHKPNQAKGKAGQCRECSKLIAVVHLRQYNAAANKGICRTCA